MFYFFNYTQISVPRKFKCNLPSVTANVSSNTITDVMCNVSKIDIGNAGKAFAALAIISVGIGFFTGKVSWGLMAGIAAGIAAIFGAPQIVSAISGNSTANC